MAAAPLPPWPAVLVGVVCTTVWGTTEAAAPHQQQQGMWVCRGVPVLWAAVGIQAAAVLLLLLLLLLLSSRLCVLHVRSTSLLCFSRRL